MGQEMNPRCPKCGSFDYYTNEDFLIESHGTVLVLDKLKSAFLPICCYCLTDMIPRNPVPNSRPLNPTEEDIKNATKLFLAGKEELKSGHINEAFDLHKAAVELGSNHALCEWLEYSIENGFNIDEAMNLFDQFYKRIQANYWVYQAGSPKMAIMHYGIAQLLQGIDPSTVKEMWENNTESYSIHEVVFNYLCEEMLHISKSREIWYDYTSLLDEKTKVKNKDVANFYKKVSDYYDKSKAAN